MLTSTTREIGRMQEPCDDLAALGGDELVDYTVIAALSDHSKYYFRYGAGRLDKL